MSFNPQDAFSSLQSFLSSGYVLLAVIAVLGIGIIKKLLSICIAAGVIFFIWFFCQDQILSALGNIIQVLGV